MESKKKINDSVRAYEKPKLRIIELAADEVLAVGCKTQGRTASGSVAPPCWIRLCSAKGS